MQDVRAHLRDHLVQTPLQCPHQRELADNGGGGKSGWQPPGTMEVQSVNLFLVAAWRGVLRAGEMKRFPT